MPFFCANCSHLVGKRGLGSGLARGNVDVGAGRLTPRPVGPLSLGNVSNALKRACVSAVAYALAVISSRVAAAEGSNAQRLPRSSSIASDTLSLQNRSYNLIQQNMHHLCHRTGTTLRTCGKCLAVRLSLSQVDLRSLRLKQIAQCDDATAAKHHSACKAGAGTCARDFR